MDEVTKNTFELCLKEWEETSSLFQDSEKWLEGLKQELAKLPEIEEEIKALGLQINLQIQSLLLNEGFNTDEIFQLMRLPPEAIAIIENMDGGFDEWRRNKRNYQR